MLPFMLRIFFTIITLCFICTTSAQSKEVTQVYLIQNSGWMEPFYNDPASKFRPLVTAFIQNTVLPGQDIIVASFNQSGAVEGEESPRLIYKGSGAGSDFNKIVDSITLPRKKNGAFADTDFEGALNGCLTRLLERQPAVIWLITNNKNDPNNSPDVIAHTTAFYHLLREHPGIRRVIAYPIALNAKGKYFRESGLMIYGLAFGQEAETTLKKIETGNVKSLFTKPIARLKPLGEEAVWFEPTKVMTDGVKASISNGILVITGVKADKGSKIVIGGKLHNSFYPQKIKSARMKLYWDGIGKGSEGKGIQNSILPDTIDDLLPAGALDNVHVTLTIPPIRTVWSFDAIMRDTYVLDSRLLLELEDQKLELAPEFSSQIDHIFGLRQLPEIFLPDTKIVTSKTVLPVRIVAEYPAWPLLLLVTLGILIFIISLTGIALFFKERKYNLEINGFPVTVLVKPFQSKPIYSHDGKVVGQLRGAFVGKPSIIQAMDQTNIAIKFK